MNEPSTNQLAVVSARLPYTDHATLSQAWYSALHLARETGSGAAPRQARAAGDLQVTAGRARAKPKPSSAGAPPRSARPVGRTFSAFAFVRGWCPAAPPAPRRIEGTMRVPVLCSQRCSVPSQVGVTLDMSEGERVHLLVRDDGRGLRVVALCTARRAPAVQRALADAALRLRLPA